jgi:peptidoglycan/xylan/chitin deacetylase (PgdA/CDA1 family)
MQTSDNMPVFERETMLTPTVTPWFGLQPEGIEEQEAQPGIEDQETQITESAGRSSGGAGPKSQMLMLSLRKRLLLAGLVVLLLTVGLFAAPPLVRHWSASATSNTSMAALHPVTSPSHASAITNTANLFMRNMQHKNWFALWSMLSPDAQALWKDEQDFTRFEQNKFGPLTLQGYTLSSALISKPWLDPDTTQVYASAATLQIGLTATAPAGLLTAPSEQDLERGIFKRTLFAMVQRGAVWQVMVAGPADQDAPVLVPAKPPITHIILPIYMYHHVSSLPTHNQLDYGLTVTTADFNAQLDWMQQQGYHAITMPELFDAFYYGRALPSKPMILTFDDGYADVYTYALPALLAHHYRGVFYIITGMINGNYVTWNEVRALDQSGMEIASHTVHHINIGAPPAYTTTQKELLVSKATLEYMLKKPIQFFCYPTGEPFHHDSAYERQVVLRDLYNDNYLGATLDPAEFNSALQNSQLPYEMPRIRVSGGETLSEFQGILAATLQEDALRLKSL